MEANASYYVGKEKDKEVAKIAENIKLTGIKDMDAFHIACAIFSESDFFITTDDRVLKYKSEKIEIVTPGEFIRRMEEKDDE
jgi:predicted nucleic acid-binding protein